MSPPIRRAVHNYELLPRASVESDDFPELERSISNVSWISRVAESLPLSIKRISSRSSYAHYITPRRRKRSIVRLLFWSVFAIPYVCIALVLLTAVFNPSYTHPPSHYRDLRSAALQSKVPGRANPRNEKVFIAASLYEAEGELTSGAWADSVLELVDLLGPDNVYFSLYEDNPTPLTKQSLLDLKQRVTCNSSIVFEDLDLSTLPRVKLPNGATRIKRIAFLAEVRNRALAPIDQNGVAYDRILYINDVNFHAIDAAQLLLSTNVDSTGRANYGAACAVDFINPFKFYDRFALRDFDGYNAGIPFFPWVTDGGSGTTRADVIANSDAVRVRSCWGGMTAFDAKMFQDPQLLEGISSPEHGPPQAGPLDSPSAPLRFRAEEEAFWEASECCLINADIQYRRTGEGMPAESGIYMNPYIRVAYDTNTLSWLSLTRRPERLYSIIHNILNHWVDFPSYNPRMTEEPGQTYHDTVWEYDDPVAAFSPNATDEALKGRWVEETHIAGPGGYCGGKQLLVINETPGHGSGKWGKYFAPSPNRRPL